MGLRVTRVLIGALAGLLLSTAVSAPSPAATEQTGVLTGRVVDARGAAIEASRVDIFPVGSNARVARAELDGSSTYRVALPPGDYHIRFTTLEPRGVVQTEWWPGAMSRSMAGVVTVAAGDESHAHARVLDLVKVYTRLTGTDRVPVGILSAFARAGDRWTRVATNQTHPESGEADHISVQPGFYRFCYQSIDTERSCFGGNSPETASTQLITPDTHFLGSTWMLEPGRSQVRGTVTRTDGTPLAGVRVYLGPSPAPEWGESVDLWPVTVTTDASGAYEFTGVSAGQYVVRAYLNGSPEQYAPGVDTVLEARRLDVVIRDSVVADIAMAGVGSGSISGSVSGPVYGGQVVAQRRVGTEWVQGAAVAVHQAGPYTLAGLRPGTYRVGASAGGAINWRAGTVTVGDGQVSGIDVQVLRNSISGLIAGQVKFADGAWAEGLKVTAYTWSDEETPATVREDLTDGHWVVSKTTTVGADGLWIMALSPGRHRFSVSVEDPRAWSELGRVAGEFTLADGQEVSAPLTTVPRPAVLAGTPSFTSGAATDGSACLYVERPGGWVNTGCARGYGGRWTTSLAPGTYRLKFVPLNQGGMTTWWRSGSTVSSAEDLVLTAGETRTVDQALPVGAVITGSVPTSVGRSFVVRAWLRTESGWEYDGYPGFGAADGTFRITGLRAGVHRLQVEADAQTVWGTGSSADLTSAPDVMVPATGTVAAPPIHVVDSWLGTTSTSRPAVITGSAAVGQVLRAHSAGWPSDTVLKYQWFAGDQPIAGATGSSVTVPASALGARLRVQVTGQVNGQRSTTALSPASARILASTVPLVTESVTPTLPAPTALEPTTLTWGTWTPSGATTSARWFADGVEIPSATGAAYTPEVTMVGRTLSVLVTATAPGAVPRTVLVTAPEAVRSPVLRALTVPTITGDPVVGQTLSATAPQWEAEANTTYVWLADGVAIPSATGRTWRVGAEYVGRRIAVRATGTSAGFQAGTATSTETAPVTRALVPGAAALSAVPRVDGTVLCHTSGWPTDADLAVGWVVNGIRDTVRTGAAITLTASDLGKSLSCEVRASGPTYAEVVTVRSESATVAPGRIVNLTRPVIRGKAAVGRTLRVTPGTWSVAVKLRYSWRANGVAIRGATGTSLKLTKAQRGKRITVRVVPRRTAYTGSAITTRSTARVAG